MIDALAALAALASVCTELQLADTRKPGVYVLLNGETVQYVGESNNVLSRVGMHSRSFEFDRILYVPEYDKRERRAIESALARRFAPLMASVYSSRDKDRDGAILARFGLEPDAENARMVTERAAACWPQETRDKAARAHTERAARRRKQKARCAKLGVAWHKDWDMRQRIVNARLLWNAVKPMLVAEAAS